MSHGAPSHGGDSRYGWPFWLAVGAGCALMAWGTLLFLDATPDARRRVDFAAWVVGLDLAHDLLLVPLVLGAAFVVKRVVRGPWRAPVQAGLIVSGFVLAVAASPLRDTAAASGNDTIQPLDYRTATLTVLAMVWVPVLAWGSWRVWLGRRAQPTGQSPSSEPTASG